ncbi:hypothetical protein CCE28_17840 [Anaeromicrobium sediminis]|uniref:Uncharacterized protein n=2 Tax=Anaeromicrobium sediminis TaxID=1478221 RepID=A0A267MGH7_9FIRM|nr:hypothetical protein CCE28_17840 [Anaeromicrobium sediminis]
MLAAPFDKTKLLHNHRVAGVTGSVIPTPGGGHVHQIFVNTDFFFNHFHEVTVTTGPAILIRDGDGNIIGHVHAIIGTTSCTFFHTHDFKGTTLIQNPLAPIGCIAFPPDSSDWLKFEED